MVLAAAALTACTRADQNNGTTGSGGNTGSGTATAETAASQSETAPETAAPEGGEEAPAQSGEGSGAENTQTAGAQGTETASETPAAVPETAEEVTEDETEAETEQESETMAAEENYSDEEWDELNEAESVDWNGTFTSAEGETLSISVVDADHISFAFTNAGVSGEAEVSGAQAVYHGDDYHVVVFDFVADSVEVSVLSEEDYDTSGSPMNGTYTRD